MPNIQKSSAWYLAKVLGYALKGLTTFEIENIADLLAKNRADPLVQKLAVYCTRFDQEFHGISNAFHENGEFWLIKQTAPLGFKTVFDIGANLGEWSKAVANYHAAAHLHAFEIVPDTYQLLKANLKDMVQQININDFGLSDTEGQVDVYVDNTSNQISSIYNFDYKTGNRIVSCRIRPGFAYCQEQGINSIDFMKIDVEGGESKVLKGFDAMFSAKKIRLVQFEYNRGAILSKFLLHDFAKYFQEKGYIIGKLFPNGVLFQDYHFNQEDFRGPNYVACLSADHALIDTISIS